MTGGADLGGGSEADVTGEADLVAGQDLRLLRPSGNRNWIVLQLSRTADWARGAGVGLTTKWTQGAGVYWPANGTRGAGFCQAADAGTGLASAGTLTPEQE
ncbi:hypothetical protein ABVT39_016132 [Epinephelus coioides]